MQGRHLSSLVMIATLVASCTVARRSSSRFPPPLALNVSKEIGYKNFLHAEVLSWAVREWGGNLPGEMILLSFEFSMDHWELVLANRLEKDAHGMGKWTIPSTRDIPSFSTCRFDHRPVESEVDRFIHDSGWSFGPVGNDGYVQGHVYTNAWQSALGYVPKHTFDGLGF